MSIEGSRFRENHIKEKEPKRSLIVSLLGPTGSGKSTLTENLTRSLGADGVSVATIKKDDAILKLSEAKYGTGKTRRGYMLFRGFSEQDLNAEINRQILELIGKVSVIFLEGGTRTREDMKITLKGVWDKAEYVIVKLDVSPREIVRRLRDRRKTEGRVDDHLVLAAGKLAGQYVRPRLSPSPKTGDPDVERVDAKLPPEQVMAAARQIIENQIVSKNISGIKLKRPSKE